LFEIDLGSTVDHNLLADAIDRECKEVGVTYSFQQKIDQKEIKENVFEYENTGDYSRISKNYLRVFNLICSGLGLNIKMRPTSSDSRFLREVSLLFVQKFYILYVLTHRKVNMYYVICIFMRNLFAKLTSHLVLYLLRKF